MSLKAVASQRNCAASVPWMLCNDVCGVMTWKWYQDFYLIHTKYSIISKCPNCLKSGIDIQFPMEKVEIQIQKYCLFNTNFWQFHKAALIFPNLIEFFMTSKYKIYIHKTIYFQTFGYWYQCLNTNGQNSLLLRSNGQTTLLLWCDKIAISRSHVSS